MVIEIFRQTFLVLGVALWIFFFQELRAQDTLSLSQCIDYALQHHPSVKAAVIDQKIARQQTREVASQGLPQVNLNGSFDDNIKIPVSAIPAIFFNKNAAPGEIVPVRFGAQYGTAGYAQLDQLIFKGSYFVGLKASKVSRIYYSQATEQAIQNLIYTVGKSYLQTLIALRQLEIRRSNLDNSKQILKITQLQYENDIVTKRDRDRLQVDYYNRLTEFKTAERQIRQSINQLKYDIAMPPKDSLLIISFLDKKEAPLEDSTLAEVHLEDRIDYRILQTQRELRQLDVRQYRSAYLPVLTGYGRYQYQAYRQKFNFFDFTQKWYNSEAVGLRLTIPVFSGFQRNAQLMQAKYNFQKACLDVARMEESIHLQVDNSRLEFETALANVRLGRENVKLATEVYDNEKMLYEQGVGAYTDYLNAENSLFVSQENLNNSLLNLYLAKIELAKARGKIDEVLKWNP